MRHIPAVLLAVLLMSGCAATGIRDPVRSRPADLKVLEAGFAEYNSSPGPVRIWGAAIHDGGPAIDFGASAAPGAGARLDLLAGPMARLLLSATCRENVGCDIFIPGELTVYRDQNTGMTPFLGALISGRVPVIAPLTGAYRDRSGEPVLEFRGRGQWQKVVFSVDGKLPERIIYGDEGEFAALEVRFADFTEKEGIVFPSTIALGGRWNAEMVVLKVLKVERVPDLPGALFAERFWPGVRIEDSSGRDSWKKLGMFWIPKE